MSNTATPQKSRKKLACFLLVSLLLVSLPSHAKVQPAHWGFGVTSAGPGYGSPQLSAEWAMNIASSLEVLMGMDTVENSNSLSLGARFNRHLFIEESLDYSAFLGGGILSASVGGAAASGFYFETGALANFYLTGLPNLGLQLGSGFRLESPGSSRIRSIFFGGFHYYF